MPERYTYESQEHLVQYPLRLGFLASHNGTDMQGIIASQHRGELHGDTRIIISNNARANALQFAADSEIPSMCINESRYGSSERVDKMIRDTLVTRGVNLVIMSGYLKRVGPLTRKAFPNRILNVHPSLLPKFAGMWGDDVHRAVLATGEKRTGVTIHTIDEEYDKGTILFQSEVVVEPHDTVESLRSRVQAEELQGFLKVLQDVQTGRMKL